MARQTKRKRRAFGACKRVRKHGRTYLEYSYPTPPEAFAKWPGLPERCYKTVPPEYAAFGEAWLSAAQVAIKAGTWTPPQAVRSAERRNAVTFREYATQWVENRRKDDGTPIKETAKQKYRESLSLYLLDFFGNMRMTDITPNDVQRWWDQFTPVRQDADPADRRRRVYRHLAAIMASAATVPADDTGTPLIDVNPCRIKSVRSRPKHQPIRPTRGQWGALMAELPAWARTVATICDTAGLRSGEALGLCARHIDTERLTIRVEQQSQRVPDGKGGYRTELTTPKTASSVRTVHIPPALADMLAAWISDNGITDPDAPLFTSPYTGRLLYPQNYRNAINRARANVPGLEAMRPHDLRKDALSRMVEAGATVSEVMRQGGHTSMAVASVYQTTGDHLGEVMARMDTTQPPHAATGTPTDQPTAPQNTTTNDDELTALAGVLAAMPTVGRVTVLRSLPADRRAIVVEAMPDGAKGETLTALLEG